MKKFLSYIVSIFVFFASFNVATLQVKAEEAHQFIIKAYDWNAIDNDYNGSGTGDELIQNADVKPGQVIKLPIYYIPGTDHLTMVQLSVNFDDTLVEPIWDNEELYTENILAGDSEVWPTSGTGVRKKMIWDVKYKQHKTRSQLRLLGIDPYPSDPTNATPLVNEGFMATAYFKIKDDAPAGSAINFSFSEDYQAGDFSFASATSKLTFEGMPPYTFSNLTLNVYGEVNSVTTLNTLSVKNGNNSYNLDPVFVPDNDTIKEYNIVVPNHITSVDVDATLTDSSKAEIISGLGTQNLNDIGNNDINIIVQAQNGTPEIYKLHVYRLNNDATLSSLSLTNDIDIGTFDKDKTTPYSATVPYKTTSTIVNASQTDSNAEIVSGTGSWSLTNYGSSINTRKVVVNAENCKDVYSIVPGNSCTSREYTIDITRTAPSFNTNLSDLTIDGIRIDGFTPSKDTYDLGNLPYETSSVDVNAIVEDTGKAEIISELGTKELVVGDNTIEIVVRAEDGTEKTFTISAHRLSNNSNLSSLLVNSDPMGTLTPAFNKDTHEYTYTAPSIVEIVTVSAEVEDIVDGVKKSTIISGPNEYNIDDTSSVNILVQAEDGTQSTYTINLVREKSNNAYLKSLSVDGYNLNEQFNRDNPSYTVNVSGEVDKVKISAEVEDTGKATITTNLDEEKSLTNFGENKFTITVKAEDGTTKDYFISVMRAKKSIAALTDLKVDSKTIDGFSETILDYPSKIVVPFEKSSVNISATVKDPDSTIISGTGDILINPGLNELYVKVLAQDGITQTTYTIRVEREKDSNAYLRELKINGQLINLLINPPTEVYDKTMLSYGITVENNITSLNIDAIPDSEYVSKDDIIISGNENFVTNEDNLVTITVTAPAGNFETYRIHVTRKKSDNNYLKDIVLSNGTLEPAFVKTINEYTVNVDRSVTSIEINPIVEDQSSTFTKSGPDSLKIGENIYTITVISEDDTKEPNVYTIKVNRLPSSNNYLKSLLIDGVSINTLIDPPTESFDKTKPSYEITVPSDRTSITISTQTEEEHATINIGSEKTFELESGTKTIDIEVTAESGEPRTYTIIVNKEKSSDSTLRDLHIVQTELNENFEPGRLNYTADVPYNVTNIDIVAMLNDSRSTISGDVNSDGTANVPLETGPNDFTIVVTSENNTPTMYTLKVTRAKNDNAKLSNIVLSDGFTLNEEFDPDSDKEYSVEVPNQVNTITITPYVQDTNATIKIQNDGQNIDLITTDVNRIPIEVTAEDGITKKTYYVNITREKSNDNTLKELTVNGQKIDLTKDGPYEIEVNNEEDTFEVTAVPNSDSIGEDGIIIDSDKTLEVGTNTKTITVIAENGDLKVYQIVITRQPSSNNYLKTLSVKDENDNEYLLNFDKLTKTYNIELENNINKLVFAGELDDSTSSAIGFDGEVSMNDKNTSFEIEKSIIVGNQSFEIVVTSASNISRTYIVNVFRKSNANNFLSSLSVKDINNKEYITEFDKTKNTYQIDVNSDITKVIINATAEAETSTIEGNATVSLVTGENTHEVIVTAEDGTPNKYTIVINKAASSNNYLSSLTVSPGTLEFNKETEEYTINVDNATKKITIDASTEHPAATIGNGELGEKDINVGEQTFNISVTAEDKGTPRVYKIKVIREASSINDLKSIKINGKLLEDFDKNKTEGYIINVDNNVDRVNIEAEALDETASVEGTGEKMLSTDENTFVISVTAQDGTVKTYTIKINRAKSSNNYLSSLTINGAKDYTPEFDKETEDFYITVPNEITSLDIEAILEDKEKATINIDGNENFIVGEDNIVYINVKAENGDIKSYKVHVTRQPQVNNFLTDIIVIGNDGVKYSLNKEFDKEHLVYDVQLPESISEVDIRVEKQEDTLNVRGDGKITINSLPQLQKIVVSTTDGLERTYTLNFIKGPSSNNQLKDIIVDKGKLEPVFTPGNSTYDVNLPAGTKDITISAVKGDEEQEVTITDNGKINLSPGRNLAHVIVLSGDKNINVYTIIIYVEEQNKDNVLSSLEVDKGTLSPNFDKDTKLYTVDLDDMEENITISATGNYSITGTGLHNLDPGANVFEIVSTDDNGAENTYRIIINRGRVESSFLKYLAVDNYNMNEGFNKETFDYTMNIYNEITSLDIIAIPEDKNKIVEITGNNDMVFGENNILITLKDNETIVNTYNIKVNIGNNKITSDIHKIDETYIRTIMEGQTSAEVKSQMTNPVEHLKIYNLDGVEISNDDIVGTGFVIKLEINNVLYDSKVLIVKGDTNGDGEVGVADIIKLRLHILETTPLNDVESIAADTNTDDDIGVADIIQIRSHILGNSNLYSEEEE